MKKDSSKPRQAAQNRKHIGRWIFLGLVVAAVIAYVILFVPFGRYDFSAAKTTTRNADGTYNYALPLDASSPWPKFRANELQNGRVPVQPVQNDLKPWSYRTGKGIFSSPVVDGQGLRTDLRRGLLELHGQGGANLHSGLPRRWD